MNIYDIKIGDEITVDMGLQLANQFGFLNIVERIEAEPERFKSFIFDGCSCIPDQLMGLFTGCKWQDITYMCCLPHDVGYAYGEIGNDAERKTVDYLFLNNLVKNAKMKHWLAKLFLKAVKIGGAEELGLSFSWGFATTTTDNSTAK